MKAPIKFVLFALVISLLCAATVVVRDGKPTKPFNREQTKGMVRIVLLSVDRTTVFTDKGFSKDKNQEIHAVPGLRIAYVMEALGNEPVTNRAGSQTSIFVDGRDLNLNLPENLSSGGVSGIGSYEHHQWEHESKKPDVTDPKRTVIFEEWHRGFRVSAGKFDLHIKTGFSQHTEEFVFENIPLE